MRRKKLRKPQTLRLASGRNSIRIRMASDRYFRRRLCIDMQNPGEHFAACFVTVGEARKLGHRFLAFADWLDQQGSTR